MKKIFILLVTVTLILFGCETNPPTDVNKEKDFGEIYVTSNVVGAEILVDNISTGKVSPDTVIAETGQRTITMVKDSYVNNSVVVTVLKDQLAVINIDLQLAGVQKVVLLEDFANVSCVPCVASNKIIEQLVNRTYGSAKLVAIKYPTNFPSPVDPFYLANPQTCDARRAYYSVIIAPTTIIDGISKPTPSDSFKVKEKIDEQLAKQPQFALEVKDSISGNQYFINVKATLLDASNLAFSNLVLHTVITETDIEFSTPPGSNGETKFYDVMRRMLPSNNGEPLGMTAQSTVKEFNWQTTLNSSWSVNKLHTVVFIQNTQTKEVYQAGSTF